MVNHPMMHTHNIRDQCAIVFSIHTIVYRLWRFVLVDLAYKVYANKKKRVIDDWNNQWKVNLSQKKYFKKYIGSPPKHVLITLHIIGYIVKCKWSDIFYIKIIFGSLGLPSKCFPPPWTFNIKYFIGLNRIPGFYYGLQFHWN
jgi:hypothetical protein